MGYRDPVIQREYQRIWAADRKAQDPVFRALGQARIRRDRESRRVLVNSLKMRLGCLFCDEKDPDRLDFHHVNPKEKVLSVSSMVTQRYQLSRIVAEIHKCVCVCKNHHADLTAMRADYLKQQKNVILNPAVAEAKRREKALTDAILHLEAHAQFRLGSDKLKIIKFLLN